MRRQLLKSLLAAALLASGCHREPASPPPVIIISVDTLRSDHLPLYGYRGVATPAIDALGAQSIVFDRAYTHCPLTLPAHASLLTGRLPADHGVRDNIGFKLNAGATTLAEVLAKRGYETGAAVSAYVLRHDTGIARGFASYDDAIEEHADQSLGGIQRKGEETEARAEAWIASHDTKPFLYFLHLYEPHAPYDAPEPYRSQYKPYDAEIASVDAIVGRFIGFLKQRGIYDRALIVFLSDHGEGLGDHGEDEHGIFLYREALQVPLLVKLPGANKSTRKSDVIGLDQVMPAILAGSAGFQSIQSSPVYSETYYPRLHFGWSDLHSLIKDTKHYIDAPQAELYDLASDPGEVTNVFGTDRRTAFAMREQIAPLKKPVSTPAAGDPEETAKLAALGYLSGGVQSSAGPLPDPKDKRGTFRDLRAAFASFRAGKDAEALHGFEAILRENPQMTDVWEVAAKAHARLGHRSEAVDAAKSGLRSNPQSATLALAVADLALEAGRFDEAARHAELAMRAEPARAHETLARIALARKDLATAEREARAAVAASPRADVRVTLARVLREQGQIKEALAVADDAARRIREERKAPLAGLAYLRGDLLARVGRGTEAEAAFREEIALNPREGRAYQRLIVLLISEGRPQEASALVFQLVEAAPTPETYATIIETMRVVGDTQGERYWTARARQAAGKQGR